MSLTPVQRELLLDGPHGWGKKQDVVKAFNGPAALIVAWRRHRAELMAAAPMGKRPYAYWMVERRLNQRPAGEAGELRAIRQFELYRDAEEKAYVEQRLAEIMEGIRTRRAGARDALGLPEALACAARKLPPELPPVEG
jgi:hypothetical protein